MALAKTLLLLALLLVVTAPRPAEPIRVLESLVKLGDNSEDAISGARLRDDRRVNIRDITLCIR